MFQSLPLVALLGLLLVFTSCERHHAGEIPEMQREHLHPQETTAAQERHGEATAPTSAPSPANFFPSPTP